jgi:hypothetical protein
MLNLSKYLHNTVETDGVCLEWRKDEIYIAISYLAEYPMSNMKFSTEKGNTKEGKVHKECSSKKDDFINY